jgi:hypothetical protein
MAASAVPRPARDAAATGANWLSMSAPALADQGMISASSSATFWAGRPGTKAGATRLRQAHIFRPNPASSIRRQEVKVFWFFSSEKNNTGQGPTPFKETAGVGVARIALGRCGAFAWARGAPPATAELPGKFGSGS